MELAVFDNDPTLYLFTSLTAGSSHIVTATSRIETILKGNEIPFTYKDTATDDLARKLFQRRAMGKKLPLLVKQGFVLGDLEEIEEWNEYGELHEAIGPVPTAPSAAKPTPAPSSSSTPAKASTQPENKDSAATLAMRTLSAEAAAVGAAKKPTPVNISTTNPLLTQKANTPTTPSKAVASGILSPRSVPLPATPTVESVEKKEGEPAKADKIVASLGKPADNKYKSDAPPKDIATGGVSEAPTAVLQHRGSNVGVASEGETKALEERQAIKEEDEDEESEEESDKDEDEESEEESDLEDDPATAVRSRLSPLHVHEKPVNTKVETEKGKAPAIGPKVAANTEESNEEDDDEDGDDEDDDEDDSEEEAPKIPAPKTQEQSAKAADKTGVSVAANGKAEQKEETKEALKTPAEKKTQEQSAKAGEKAGVSVED